jgi:hypothetical protein
LSSIHIELPPAKTQKVNWDDRRRIIFKNKVAITNLQELIGKAKSDGTSHAVFKPSKIHDFVIESADRDWNTEKLESLRNLSKQMNLFQTVEEIESEYKVVPKVPYKFSYTFEDDSGKQSTMMIEDWEIGMLYFNCLKRANGDENVAVANVRKKYFDEFMTKDLYFFMGTTKQFHNVAPNPFIIIGVFYPPMQSQNQQIGLLAFDGQEGDCRSTGTTIESRKLLEQK